ncbi:unnamed protein product [Paramecium sonneborni]|uniref:Protein kinase domain-containing protein n=1 Tax=Paramecium sonneborni TaxID=65129 RepID=A0A8S1Q8Y4_9CILI|nr:unnamed protein product [Paramecium sonneborni]
MKGDYQIITNNILGQGKYGNTYKCYKKDNQDELFCMKIIKIQDKSKPLFCQKTMEAEKQIFYKLRNIECENLVKMITFFQTKEEFCLVMELCDLDLQQLFQNYRQEKQWFSREEQVNIIRQILKGAQVLKENKIVHRDIKPQNILVKIQNLGEKNERRIFKIADFGFSKTLQDIYQEQDMTRIGSKRYQAPEIFHNELFSAKCDIYSYGILFHQIVFQKLFPGGYRSVQFNHLKFFEEIKKKPYQCQPQQDPLGKLLINLIQEMLIFDQNKRISFEDLLEYHLFLLNDPLFKPITQKNISQQNLQDKQTIFSRIHKILDNLYRKSLLCQKTAEELKNTKIFRNVNIINIYYLILQIGFQEIQIAFAMINIIISDFQPKILNNCDLPQFIELLKLYLNSQDQKFINLHNKIRLQFHQQKKNLQQIQINLMLQYHDQIVQQNEYYLFSIKTQSEKQPIEILCQQLKSLIDVQVTYQLIQQYDKQLLEFIKKISQIEILFDFFEYQYYESDFIIKL